VAFRVPYTLEELALGVVGDQDAGEALDLVAMLEPLTVAEANLRQEAFVQGERTGFTEGDEGHLYMCKHWDEETRLCNDYENRPPMCRTFPYGKPCRYGCTCAGVKPGPEVIV
jgi:Fe-S-cluster containining protein